MVQRARQPAMETETMSNRILSESELATHIEDLAGCEARRAVAERLAAEAYADGARTIADLDARWPEDAPFFSCYAAAADEIDGGAPLLYWRSADGQVDLYGGEHAADIDKAAEAATFLRELLAQCGTETERASIAAGRVEWVAS
jgi:hypothetical protein